MAISAYFDNLSDEEKRLFVQKRNDAKKAKHELNQTKQFKTLSSAVEAKCKECIYDPYGGGTWRQQVQGCTSFGCPLFEWRPGA